MKERKDRENEGNTNLETDEDEIFKNLSRAPVVVSPWEKRKQYGDVIQVKLRRKKHAALLLLVLQGLMMLMMLLMRIHNNNELKRGLGLKVRWVKSSF